MKTLSIVGNNNQFKINETGTLIPFQFGSNGNPGFISNTDTAVFNIKNETGLVAQVTPVVRQNGYLPCLNTADLTNLPVGVYQCELWVTDSHKLTNIYPDNNFVSFNINENATMETGSVIATTTIADFKQQLQDYIQKRMSTIKGAKGDPGSPPTILIGNVLTLPPSANASANFSDNPDGSYSLNLGIPQGITGQTGAPPIINIGNVSTLAPGSNATATLTNNNDGSYNLNLGLPAGNNGADGANGTNGTLQYWTATSGSGSSLEFTQDGIHPVKNYTGTDSPNGIANGTALDFSNTGANNNGLQFFTDYNNNLYYRSFNNTNTYLPWINISGQVTVTTYSLVPCAGWQAAGSIYLIQGSGLTIWSGEAWLIPNNDINSIVSAAQFPTSFPQWKDLPIACRWSGTHTIVVENDGNGYFAPNGTVKGGTECHMNFSFVTAYEGG